MKSKPLPPFGGLLRDLILHGRRPNNDVFIFLGDGALRKAKSFGKDQFVMALADSDSPGDYTWPVDDMPVLICERSPQPSHRIKALVQTLFEHNCGHVTLIRHDLTPEVHMRGNSNDNS